MPRARKDPPPPWGSITRRTTSKGRERFRVRYEAPGHNGKRIQRSETVGSWQTGLDLLQRRELELLEGPQPKARRELTLAAYLDEWLSQLPGGPAGEATQGLYAQAVRLWIVPTLGQHRLSTLTTTDVRRAAQSLQSRNLAPRTVQRAIRILSTALNAAVADKIIPTNPARGLRLAASERMPPPVWTRDQVRCFVAETDDTPLGPLWRLLLDTGMRIGEALALRRDDLDLDKGMVMIQRTVSRDRDRRRIIRETTKTGASRRVGLIAATVAALRGHIQDVRQQRLATITWQDQGLIFPNVTGGILGADRVSRQLDQEIAAAQLPRLTIHGLRHTNATLLIQAGVPITVVAQRLGHKRVSMTLDVYAHVLAEMESAALEAIETLFGDDLATVV